MENPGPDRHSGKFTSRSRRKVGTGSSLPCCCHGPVDYSGRSAAGGFGQLWKMVEVGAEDCSLLDVCPRTVKGL